MRAMAAHLCIRAGREALARLRDGGLRADDVTAMLGASGGPKWLVLSQLDRALHILFGDHGRGDVLTHPTIHTHLIAARSRWPVASDARIPLTLGLGAAAVANLMSRRLLSGFFERVVFHTGAPAFRFRGFGTTHVPLAVANLDAAALASGSIPLVMDGVEGIPGAHPGRYRDGGIIDYHFDFAFEGGQGLMLYPHFFDRITPDWFDKALSWRRPTGSALARTVFVAPSAEFVATLPGGKIPDRNDFHAFPTRERQRRWQTVVDRCRVLADEFRDLWLGGRLGAVARPFD